VSPQHRGHLAVADFETGLQDHRRFPARQIALRFAPCSASSYSLTARSSRCFTPNSGSFARSAGFLHKVPGGTPNWSKWLS
jgi:hypothetical protein